MRSQSRDLKSSGIPCLIKKRANEQESTFNPRLLPVFPMGNKQQFAANPYVTALGDPKSATRRLNLAQSFNGLGAFIVTMRSIR